MENNSVSGDVSKPFAHSGAQAANPLDFITKNLRNAEPAPAQPVITQPVVTQPEPVAEAQSAEAEEFNPMPAELEEVAPEAEAPVEVAAEEEEFTDLPAENPAAANWGKLKGALKETKAAYKETVEKLTKAEQELEEFRTGKKVPDALQAREDEIAQLRRYQKVVDLKSTPEYQEKFAKPLTQTGNKLKQIFTEYELSDRDLKELRGASLAEQNAFISNHFDPVAGIEIRKLLDHEKEVVTAMQAAEAEPEAELNRLTQEAARVKLVKEKQQRELMTAEFRDGWSRSLQKIKEKGTFAELIYRPNDSKYNKEVVDPILKEAGHAAGKFVKELVKNGLHTLTPELAETISNMMLKGHSSAVNAVTRERALKYAKELEANTARVNSVSRPVMGSAGAVSLTPEKPREPMTPQNVGSAILNKIGVK